MSRRLNKSLRHRPFLAILGVAAQLLALQAGCSLSPNADDNTSELGQAVTPPQNGTARPAEKPPEKDPRKEEREKKERERREKLEELRKRERENPTDRATVADVQRQESEILKEILKEADAAKDARDFARQEELVKQAEALEKELDARQEKLDKMREERRAEVVKDVLEFLKEQRAPAEQIEKVKKSLEDPKVLDALKDAKDLAVALKILEVMGSDRYDAEFAKQVSEWVTWMEEKRDIYKDKTIEEMFDIYVAEWAAKNGYNVNKIPDEILGAEDFARRFAPKDGKHTIPGRDQGFQNLEGEKADEKSRWEAHQQLIHFFQVAALLKLEKEAMEKLLDIIGEFKFTGKDIIIEANGGRDASTTFWGVLFDNLLGDHMWPLVPENGSGSVQRWYKELLEQKKKSSSSSPSSFLMPLHYDTDLVIVRPQPLYATNSNNHTLHTVHVH